MMCRISGEIIQEDIEGDVLEVFIGKDINQLFSNVGETEGGSTVAEGCNDGVVATAALIGHCGFISMADAVLDGEAAVVLGSLFRGDRWEIGTDRGWGDV